MSYTPAITFEESRIRTFPCGERDNSEGHLWTCVRHTRTCPHRHCIAWRFWFEDFRSAWLRHFGRE